MAHIHDEGDAALGGRVAMRRPTARSRVSARSAPRVVWSGGLTEMRALRANVWPMFSITSTSNDEPGMRGLMSTMTYGSACSR